MERCITERTYLMNMEEELVIMIILTMKDQIFLRIQFALF